MREIAFYGLEAEWEIGYQDTFDREGPRQVEIAGQGEELV